MTREQWISTILTAVLGLVYVTIRIVEHVTSQPRNETVFIDGVAQTKTVTPKGIDFDDFRFVVGFGAWLTFIWALQAFGAFNN